MYFNALIAARRLGVLLVLVLTAIAGRIRVEHGRCPEGSDLRTGIRRDGRFECWPRPVAPPGWRASDGPIEEWDGTWERPERSLQPATIARFQLICRQGQPVVLDWQSVGCR